MGPQPRQQPQRQPQPRQQGADASLVRPKTEERYK
jgi:hypothetical protein